MPQVIEDESEKVPSPEPPAANRSAEVPENFANIFPNNHSVAEVIEEAEVTEVAEGATETIEPEEKKEIDAEEHR